MGNLKLWGQEKQTLLDLNSWNLTKLISMKFNSLAVTRNLGDGERLVNKYSVTVR
jgi:hypothetical protein